MLEAIPLSPDGAIYHDNHVVTHTSVPVGLCIGTKGRYTLYDITRNEFTNWSDTESVPPTEYGSDIITLSEREVTVYNVYCDSVSWTPPDAGVNEDGSRNMDIIINSMDTSGNGSVEHPFRNVAWALQYVMYYAEKLAECPQCNVYVCLRITGIVDYPLHILSENRRIYGRDRLILDFEGAHVYVADNINKNYFKGGWSYSLLNGDGVYVYNFDATIEFGNACLNIRGSASSRLGTYPVDCYNCTLDITDIMHTTHVPGQAVYGECISAEVVVGCSFSFNTTGADYVESYYLLNSVYVYNIDGDMFNQGVKQFNGKSIRYVFADGAVVNCHIRIYSHTYLRTGAYTEWYGSVIWASHVYNAIVECIDCTLVGGSRHYLELLTGISVYNSKVIGVLHLTSMQSHIKPDKLFNSVIDVSTNADGEGTSVIHMGQAHNCDIYLSQSDAFPLNEIFAIYHCNIVVDTNISSEAGFSGAMLEVSDAITASTITTKMVGQSATAYSVDCDVSGSTFITDTTITHTVETSVYDARYNYLDGLLLKGTGDVFLSGVHATTHITGASTYQTCGIAARSPYLDITYIDCTWNTECKSADNEDYCEDFECSLDN